MAKDVALDAIDKVGEAADKACDKSIQVVIVGAPMLMLYARVKLDSDALEATDGGDVEEPYVYCDSSG